MHKILYLIAKLNAEQGKAPEWMVLFAAGWGKLADGTKYLVDKAGFDLVVAMIESRGNEIHFDYEHASVQERAALGNGAPAAGWIKELAWEDGVGIKARMEWTDKASVHIAAKEYRYFSPVFAVRKSDSRVCYLDSVALTNRPKTNNLTPILAALEAGLGQSKEETMDRKKLIAAMGLKDDATDLEILLAIAALGVTVPDAKAGEAIPKAVIAALDLAESDGESVVVASIHALKQAKATAVSVEDFNALKQQITDRDAADVVTAAMEAGKVTPDQKDWATKYAAKDLEGFKVYVAKAPVVVPVNKLPGKEETAEDGTLSETDLTVAGMMGVDEADLKTHGLGVTNG